MRVSAKDIFFQNCRADKHASTERKVQPNTDKPLLEEYLRSHSLAWLKNEKNLTPTFPKTYKELSKTTHTHQSKEHEKLNAVVVGVKAGFAWFLFYAAL